jgi:hypothetical protein
LEAGETPSSFSASSKIVFPGDFPYYFLGLDLTTTFEIFSFLLDFLGALALLTFTGFSGAVTLAILTSGMLLLGT